MYKMQRIKRTTKAREIAQSIDPYFEFKLLKHGGRGGICCKVTVGEIKRDGSLALSGYQAEPTYLAPDQ